MSKRNIVIKVAIGPLTREQTRAFAEAVAKLADITCTALEVDAVCSIATSDNLPEESAPESRHVPASQAN